MEKYKFPHDPVANPASIVTGKGQEGHYRFTLINETVLRYEWSADGLFEDRASTFALNRNFPPPQFTVNDVSPTRLEIRTPSYQVTYNKRRFDRYGLVISFSNKNSLWGADWRYGEKADGNLGGTARTLDEVNGRCELEPGILSRWGYSVIDDGESVLFTEGGFVAPRREGDRQDGYLFSYGFEYGKAMAAYFDISGEQPKLPRYALGNWWSRYYAYTDKEYIDLMDKFSKEQVPLSVAVIDMDWHEVFGDHIPHAGWTGYTWEKKYFPDPKKFGEELHNRKLKMTLNDHPHAGIHHHEALYEEMAKELGHDTSSKAPILFDPTSEKFMYAYLNTLHRKLEGECDFWWVDWQQGPYSNVPGLDPLWLLNHFHFLDHEKENGKDRALIFSRYAGPGSHRYPVGFSGDSIMTWESLAFQPEFTATASNIGFGWWSNDIGGHMGGYRDDELAARWVQLGVFSPVMRLHSSNSPWASKEPWLYREEFASSMAKFMRLRHRMLPYLYTANVASKEPIVRPLYWSFPQRDEAYGKPNEYYFGPSGKAEDAPFGTGLVVAPITEKRQKATNLAAVDVWVPPGRHVDILSGLIYDGDREIKMWRDIQSLPVLAPAGSIIPLDSVNAEEHGTTNPDGYEVLVIVGKDGQFKIIEEWDDDDSKSDNTAEKEIGQRREIDLSWKQSTGSLVIHSPAKDWTLRFPGILTVPESLSITVNNEKETLDDAPYIDTDTDGALAPGLVVKVGSKGRKNVDITLDLGADPQLGKVDPIPRVQKFLLDAQMDNHVKDRIWGVVKSEGVPVTTKVGQLLGFGLGEEITSPLVEILVADGR